MLRAGACWGSLGFIGAFRADKACRVMRFRSLRSIGVQGLVVVEELCELWHICCNRELGFRE